MNTIWADRDGVHDTLDAGAAEWLRAAGRELLADLPRDDAGLEAELREDVARMRRFREALRRLTAAVSAGGLRGTGLRALLRARPPAAGLVLGRVRQPGPRGPALSPPPRLCGV